MTFPRNPLLVLALLAATAPAALPSAATAQSYSGGYPAQGYPAQGYPNQSQTEVDGQGYAAPGYPAQSQTEVDGQYSAPAGQASQQVPPQLRADTERALHYPLPPDFMSRATATIADLQARNIQPPNTQGATLDQTIARIGQVSGLTEILRAHGFTPESFVMGMTAFGITLASSSGQAPKGMPSPNANNLALFRAHPEEVNTLVQAMGSPPNRQQ